MPTISVTPGDIGQKTDRNNLLTYSITGEMSTITEKINGTVVNTRNTTSGQAVTLGLTQAQWDAIRFGKYADATGGKNTLTVEMGTDKWTYTFDKRLATDADIVSAVKATKDANEVYLPSVKKQLADAINAKGGSVSANADWLTMIGGLSGITSGKKWAIGTASSNSSSILTVSGLSFKPSIVIVHADSAPPTERFAVGVTANLWGGSFSQLNSYLGAGSAYNASYSPANGGFSITVYNANTVHNWIAIE